MIIVYITISGKDLLFDLRRKSRKEEEIIIDKMIIILPLQFHSFLS